MFKSISRSPTWLVFLTVVAVYICFIDRIAISIAIIPMAAENNWSPSVQGGVMAAFFIGYLTLQIPAGYLADRFGGKWVLGGGVLLWSLFTLLTPPAAALGLSALLTCRFLMGVAEAVTWPSIYALYAKWVASDKRATAVGFMNSGIAGGSVIALVATPFIIEAFSWQAAFYLYGAVGLVWFLIWTPTTRSRPPFPIDDPDREDNALAAAEAAADVAAKSPVADTEPSPANSNEAPLPRITPAALLRSPAVWAITVAHMCANWTIFLMLSWLPTYINQGLGADFSTIGLLAVLPSVAAMLSTPIAGRVFDRVVNGGVPRLRARRIMQSLAFGSIALGLGVLGYIESVGLAVVIVTLSNAMTACCVGGFATNHLDIAPNQSGMLMGVTNTAGAMASGLAVFVSGVVLQYTGSWVAVFQLAALVAIFGAVFYWRYASVSREFD